uniref:AP2/ERF domain-containing protein n=1 Tax=Araucaria cunninghamii TaxID=56994 RepID=A0A0D6QSF1_ARACU
MDSSSEQQNAPAAGPPDMEAEKFQQYKGIRLRKWGKWVSEVRLPKCRDKIWLGSYDTAEQAARAYDAAVFCLRGPKAKLNFPNSIPDIPSASSLTREQIQAAAAKYALNQFPSSGNQSTVLAEEPVSPSRSSSVSEKEASSDGQMAASQEQGSTIWDTLFGDCDDSPCMDLEKFPSLDAAATMELTSPAEEQGYIYVDPDLWNF